MNPESIEIEIEAWLCPCLTLHHYADLDFTRPITLACPVNMRPLSLTRLGHNCTNPDNAENLLYQMRREKKNSIPTCLSGGFILVFTSYSNDTTTTKNNVMVPIDRIEQPVTSFTAATELTNAILLDAIKWLKGSTEELSSDEEALDRVGLLKLYLKTLSDKIRCLHHLSHGYIEQKDVIRTMRHFIVDRTWQASMVADSTLPQDMDKFLANEGNIDFSRLCTQARRFIYKRIARQTKVVAHILDGNHRIAALECALGGHTYSQNNPSDNTLIMYTRNLPHAETKINLRAIVLPPGPLEETFAINMREISAEAQVAVGRMQPHGKKIFYTIMIDKLRESCKCENMTYLLGSNDEINEEYIQEHIQSCARIILKIIQDHGTLYTHMVGKMELEKGLKKKLLTQGMDLFKKKETARFTYHWDSRLTSVYTTFLATQDFHKSTRYNIGFPAELFELVQVLLWTRISQDCDNQLHRFFEHSNPSTKQLSAGSIDKEAKWVTCMITTVGSSVFYSNAVLKKKKKKRQCSSPCLIPKLICSAVRITTDFFSMRGIDLTNWRTGNNTKM